MPDADSTQKVWRVGSAGAEVPAKTATSDALSKDLLRRGFKFVGSTICYALMQATGMVNDHLVSCFRHGQVSQVSQSSRSQKTAGGPGARRSRGKHE